MEGWAARVELEEMQERPTGMVVLAAARDHTTLPSENSATVVRVVMRWVVGYIFCLVVT
jgi:hypothetical protein